MRSRSFAHVMPLIAPVHILILSMIVIPSIFVIWLSVTKSSYGLAPTYVGLENYIRVLSDPAFLRALRNTVVIVVFAVHVELGIGLLVALFPRKLLVNRGNRRGRYRSKPRCGNLCSHIGHL